MAIRRNGRVMSKAESCTFLCCLGIAILLVNLNMSARGELRGCSLMGREGLECFVSAGTKAILTHAGVLLAAVIYVLEIIIEPFVTHKRENIVNNVISAAIILVMTFLMAPQLGAAKLFATHIEASGHSGLFGMTRLVMDARSDLRTDDCEVIEVDKCNVTFGDVGSAAFFRDGKFVAKIQAGRGECVLMDERFPEGHPSSIIVFKKSRFLSGYDTIDKAENHKVSDTSGDKNIPQVKLPYERYYVIEHIGDKLIYRHSVDDPENRLDYDEFDEYVGWAIIEEGTADSPDAIQYGIEDRHLTDCKVNEVLDTVISEPYEIALYCNVNGERTRMSNVFSYRDIDRPAGEEPDYPQHEEFYIIEKVGGKLVWRHGLEGYDEIYEGLDKCVCWIAFQPGTADEEHDLNVDLAGSGFPMYEYNEAPAYLMTFGREIALFCNLNGKQTRMSNILREGDD